jgi:hypothetical protein
MPPKLWEREPGARLLGGGSPSQSPQCCMERASRLRWCFKALHALASGCARQSLERLDTWRRQLRAAFYQFVSGPQVCRRGSAFCLAMAPPVWPWSRSRFLNLASFTGIYVDVSKTGKPAYKRAIHINLGAGAQRHARARIWCCMQPLPRFHAPAYYGQLLLSMQIFPP